jgi:hypothetical protein
VNFDQAGIAWSQNHCATLIADLLFRALDHAMAFASSTCTNLARSGNFEPFFGSGFRLHFGHFAIPYKALLKPPWHALTQARRL